jgi:hypothetical protein
MRKHGLRVSEPEESRGGGEAGASGNEVPVQGVREGVAGAGRITEKERKREMSIELKARDYVLMTPKLNYDAIVAHAAKAFVTENDRTAFVSAVLHADIVMSNEKTAKDIFA